jgi:hypothetical protein
MSVQPPPNPNISTFNPLYWGTSETYITQAYANLHYLKFPIAQGTETLVETIVAGNLSISGLGNYLQFPDGSQQTTAFTGGVVPSGLIVSYSGSSSLSATNWLLCNGSAVSRATYSSLFTAIGTIYGVGDGITTFNLPSLVNRYIQGTTTNTGVISGANSVSLATANLPLSTATLAVVGANVPVVFNSPSGISDWSYLKGTPSGDSSTSFYNPRSSSGTSNGTNLISSFTATIGQAIPTAISTIPASLLLQYYIKT